MNHQELIEYLEQYKRKDGTYHIHRLIEDEYPHATSLEITFATFFGDDFVASELVTLARQLNEQHGEQQQVKNDKQAKEIMEKKGALTNQELDFLVETGYAERVYDDLDSNRPTGIVLIKQQDKPHADWETEEGLARLGL